MLYIKENELPKNRRLSTNSVNNSDEDTRYHSLCVSSEESSEINRSKNQTNYHNQNEVERNKKESVKNSTAPSENIYCNGSAENTYSNEKKDSSNNEENFKNDENNTKHENYKMFNDYLHGDFVLRGNIFKSFAEKCKILVKQIFHMPLRPALYSPYDEEFNSVSEKELNLLLKRFTFDIMDVITIHKCFLRMDRFTSYLNRVYFENDFKYQVKEELDVYYKILNSGKSKNSMETSFMFKIAYNKTVLNFVNELLIKECKTVSTICVAEASINGGIYKIDPSFFVYDSIQNKKKILYDAMMNFSYDKLLEINNTVVDFRKWCILNCEKNINGCGNKTFEPFSDLSCNDQIKFKTFIGLFSDNKILQENIENIFGSNIKNRTVSFCIENSPYNTFSAPINAENSVENCIQSANCYNHNEFTFNETYKCDEYKRSTLYHRIKSEEHENDVLNLNKRGSTVSLPSFQTNHEENIKLEKSKTDESQDFRPNSHVDLNNPKSGNFHKNMPNIAYLKNACYNNEYYINPQLYEPKLSNLMAYKELCHTIDKSNPSAALFEAIKSCYLRNTKIEDRRIYRDTCVVVCKVCIKKLYGNPIGMVTYDNNWKEMLDSVSHCFQSLKNFVDVFTSLLLDNCIKELTFLFEFHTHPIVNKRMKCYMDRNFKDKVRSLLHMIENPSSSSSWDSRKSPPLSAENKNTNKDSIILDYDFYLWPNKVTELIKTEICSVDDFMFDKISKYSNGRVSSINHCNVDSNYLLYNLLKPLSIPLMNELADGQILHTENYTQRNAGCVYSETTTESDSEEGMPKRVRISELRDAKVKLVQSVMDPINGTINTEVEKKSSIYSNKVFIGGLPSDMNESKIASAFSNFASFEVDWPHKNDETNNDSNNSTGKLKVPPKGYVFLLFKNPKNVEELLSACSIKEKKYFFNIKINDTDFKQVQVRPWLKSDSTFPKKSSLKINDVSMGLSLFVGGIPRQSTANEVYTILSNYCDDGIDRVHIDVDQEYKYPKGAARVVFSSKCALMKMMFKHFLNYPGIKKKIEVKPYFSDSHFCSQSKYCEVARKKVQMFCNCADCGEYFCDSCYTEHLSEYPTHEEYQCSSTTHKKYFNGGSRS